MLEVTFSDPELLDPRVHCYTRCPWCRQLVAVEFDPEGLIIRDRLCPKCGAHFPEQMVAAGFFQNFYHTQAVTSANKFISLDLAVIPFLLAQLLVTWMGFPIWFRLIYASIYLGNVVIGLRWFYRFWYSTRFTDDEYLAAVSLMKRFLAAWSVALIVVWLSLVIEIYR